MAICEECGLPFDVCNALALYRHAIKQYEPIRAALKKIADDDFGPNDGDLWDGPGMPWTNLARRVLEKQGEPQESAKTAASWYDDYLAAYRQSSSPFVAHQSSGPGL